MKTHKLEKSEAGVKTTYFILIGKEEARVNKEVDGRRDTSVQVITPLEGTQRLNDLLRRGYKAV